VSASLSVPQTWHSFDEGKKEFDKLIEQLRDHFRKASGQ
jgi:hypothetical protein